MKTLFIFKDGNRFVADTLAIMWPQHPMNVETKISLENATDEEFQQLKENPKNQALLDDISKRNIDLTMK